MEAWKELDRAYGLDGESQGSGGRPQGSGGTQGPTGSQCPPQVRSGEEARYGQGSRLMFHI